MKFKYFSQDLLATSIQPTNSDPRVPDKGTWELRALPINAGSMILLPKEDTSSKALHRVFPQTLVPGVTQRTSHRRDLVSVSLLSHVTSREKLQKGNRNLRKLILVFPFSQTTAENQHLLGNSKSVRPGPWIFANRPNSTRMLRNPENFILVRDWLGCWF